MEWLYIMGFATGSSLTLGGCVLYFRTDIANSDRIRIESKATEELLMAQRDEERRAHEKVKDSLKAELRVATNLNAKYLREMNARAA